MDEPFDQLRRLPDAAGAVEPVASLRERVTRRHRRRRLGASAAIVALAIPAAAIAYSIAADDPSAEVRTVTPPPTTQPAEPDPTDDEASSDIIRAIPEGAQVLLSRGSSGVDVGIDEIDRSGTVRQRWDEPTAVAIRLDQHFVVAQRAERTGTFPPTPDTSGLVVIIRSTTSELRPDDGERWVLHDAGQVPDRRAGPRVALVSSIRGNGPDDTTVRLLLVNLATGDRTDLGVVGGWEALPTQARLIGERAVVVRTDRSPDGHLESRTFHGHVEWETPLGSGGPESPIVAAGTELLRITLSGSPGVGSVPHTITRIDPTSGAELGTIEIDTEACPIADWLDGSLLCSRSNGSPSIVDLDTGVATPLGEFPSAVATGPRPLPFDAGTPPPAVPVFAEECEPEIQEFAEVDGSGTKDAISLTQAEGGEDSLVRVCLESGAVIEQAVERSTEIEIVDLTGNGAVAVGAVQTWGAGRSVTMHELIDGELVVVRRTDTGEPLRLVTQWSPRTGWGCEQRGDDRLVVLVEMDGGSWTRELLRVVGDEARLAETQTGQGDQDLEPHDLVARCD